MKFLLSGILCVCLVLMGCSSSSTTAPAATGMGATIDGAVWTASLAAQAVNTSGVLAISGNGDGKQVQLTLLGVTTTGTYDIGGSFTNPNAAVLALGTTPDKIYSANLVAGSGSVTITTFSATEVAGTFTFTGVNTAMANKSVTNGTFNLKF